MKNKKARFNWLIKTPTCTIREQLLLSQELNFTVFFFSHFSSAIPFLAGGMVYIKDLIQLSYPTKAKYMYFLLK